VANPLLPRRTVLPRGSSRSIHWHEVCWGRCILVCSLYLYNSGRGDNQSLENRRWNWSSATAQLTQDGKATSDSLLNMTPHAEIAVNVDSEVTHRHWQNDDIGPDLVCWPQQLMPSTGTEEQRRRGLQRSSSYWCLAEDVGLLPVVYIIYARRQTLPKVICVQRPARLLEPYTCASSA